MSVVIAVGQLGVGLSTAQTGRLGIQVKSGLHVGGTVVAVIGLRPIILRVIPHLHQTAAQLLPGNVAQGVHLPVDLGRFGKLVGVQVGLHLGLQFRLCGGGGFRLRFGLGIRSPAYRTGFVPFGRQWSGDWMRAVGGGLPALARFPFLHSGIGRHPRLNLLPCESFRLIKRTSGWNRALGSRREESSTWGSSSPPVSHRLGLGGDATSGKTTGSVPPPSRPLAARAATRTTPAQAAAIPPLAPRERVNFFLRFRFRGGFRLRIQFGRVPLLPVLRRRPRDARPG